MGRAIQRAGEVPKHLAIIMDGNRRYAESCGLGSGGGHNEGFGKLTEVLEWCHELGIEHVSVYAFSLANFTRDEKEVHSLMALAEEKLNELAEDRHQVAHRLGVQIRVEGDLGALPETVQRAAAKAMVATRGNTQSFVLHVCMAYGGLEDMEQAWSKVDEGIHQGYLGEGDRCTRCLEGCLWGGDSPPVDLLVRTSGVSRLSGFLLWQARHAELAFLRPLWPEISFFDVAYALLRFHRAAHDVRSRLQLATSAKWQYGKDADPKRVERFLQLRRCALRDWEDRAANSQLPLPEWPPPLPLEMDCGCNGKCR